MAIPTKVSVASKSYWHAVIAIAGAVGTKALLVLNAYLAKHTGVTYTVSGAVGALLAPLTRALVAKYPLLSPLTYRITTKISSVTNQAGVVTAPSSQA